MCLQRIAFLPGLCMILVFFFCQPPAKAAITDHYPMEDTVAKAAADTIIKGCSKSEQVEKIITDAISIGVPVYNSGYHLACYRIYEWAGYKILYEYGTTCKEVEKVLKTAIEKSHGDYSDLEKAWIMRAAFDKIMGVPTQTGDPAPKKETDSKG